MSKNKSLTIALSAQLIELGGTAPTEIKLLPAGRFKAKDGRPQGLPGWTMNDVGAAAILTAAGKQTDKYLIDYEHQTLHSKANGKPAPAAGWFGELEWRAGNGLYATDVQWTAAAQTSIEAREYRYISPVLTYNPNTGDVTGLLMAALVNYPALDGLNDLAAAHFNFYQPTSENTMNKEHLAALGLQEGADDGAVLSAINTLKEQAAQVAALSAQIEALKAPDPIRFVPVAVVAELQTQLAALSTKVAASEIDDLIKSNLTRLPTPGLQAWAKSQTVEALSAYLANAPEVPALAGMQTDGKAPGATDQDPITDETAHKASWNANAELRAEFGDFETYAAFAKADAGGLVKIKGDK